MFKFLKKSWFGAAASRGPGFRQTGLRDGPAAASVPADDGPLHTRPGQVDELRYPPVDPGLPAASIKAIVHSQHGLIERLRQVVVSPIEPFDTYYLRPIEAVARYVHLLPASGFEHFSGPGGLFRLCVEMAFHCRQAADGRIFVPTGSAETRHQLEPRWRYAAFLSGLLCEIYRPLRSAIVTDRNGRPWPKFMESLEDWLDTRRVDRYFITWQAGALTVSGGAEGAAILGEIVPREQLAWLNAGSPGIVREVFSVALGQARGGDSVLGDLVQTMRERILQADALTRRSRYGHLRLGHHLEPHLLDALRSRLASGEWPLHNGIDGPFWYGTDGLYLAWPSSAELLRQYAEAQGLAGVPRSAFTLAELLGQAGLLVPASSGQWLWKLLVSDPGPTRSPVYRTALRFRHPGALFGYLQPSCLPRPFAAQSLLQEPAHPSQEGLGGLCVPSASHAPALLVVPAVAGPATPQGSGGSPPVRAAGSAGTSGRPPNLASGRRPDGLPPDGSKSRRPDLPHPCHAELFSEWRALHDARAEHLLVALPGGRIAIAEECLAQHALDLVSVVSDMERHGWLGRGDWHGRATRIGLLPFAGGAKLGFVLNASAAQAWGLL